MPSSLPYTEKISQGASQRIVYRYKEVKFGDGYSQRAKDGINNRVQLWDIVWLNVNSSEKSSILSTFDSIQGVDYFTWQPPGESTTQKFVQDSEVSLTIKSGSLWDIGVSLRQVFDV